MNLICNASIAGFSRMEHTCACKWFPVVLYTSYIMKNAKWTPFMILYIRFWFLHTKIWSFHVIQGASAAANATILLYIFLYPTNVVYLHFFIPIPAALAVRSFYLYWWNLLNMWVLGSENRIYLTLLISGSWFDLCWSLEGQEGTPFFSECRAF